MATLDSAQATLATRLPSTWPPLPLPPSQDVSVEVVGEARCLECLATPTHQPSLMSLKSVRVIYNQFQPTAELNRNNNKYYRLVNFLLLLHGYDLMKRCLCLQVHHPLDESLQGASSDVRPPLGVLRTVVEIKLDTAQHQLRSFVRAGHSALAWPGIEILMKGHPSKTQGTTLTHPSSDTRPPQ